MDTPRSATFLASLRPALVLFLLLTALTGLLYPLVVTALAQLLFPQQAAGSIVTRDGWQVLRDLASDAPDPTPMTVATVKSGTAAVSVAKIASRALVGSQVDRRPPTKAPIIDDTLKAAPAFHITARARE